MSRYRHPLVAKREKFDSYSNWGVVANSVLVPWDKVVFNGSISRNQVNASCAARTSFTFYPKYNLCCSPGERRYPKPSRVRACRKAFVKNCSAVAGYYLWCLVIEPHC